MVSETIFYVSNCKSMGAICCHGNHSFDTICPKTKYSLSPFPMMLQIKFACDQLTGCGYKLTRNKNARHIFPRHFLTVAMIGIKCLYMHFVLYIFHTRSLFFKYLHYFRSYDTQCTKCTCTSCARTTRLFDANICF